MKILVLFALLLSTTAFAQKKATPLDQVKAYAAAHDSTVTVRTWHGNVWVEVEGLDPHGVGKTIDEAATDFLHCADMMDHEPVDPAQSAAQCPADQNCI